MHPLGRLLGVQQFAQANRVGERLGQVDEVGVGVVEAAQPPGAGQQRRQRDIPDRRQPRAQECPVLGAVDRPHVELLLDEIPVEPEPPPGRAGAADAGRAITVWPSRSRRRGAQQPEQVRARQACRRERVENVRHPAPEGNRATAPGIRVGVRLGQEARQLQYVRLRRLA